MKEEIFGTMVFVITTEVVKLEIHFKSRNISR